MNLFAYGTLMEPRLLERITGLSPASKTATLSGYQRLAFKRESFPGIIPADERESVTGVLFLDLSAFAWKYLDGFEGNMYERVAIFVDTNTKPENEAQTYIVRTEYRHLLSESDWDFAEFLRRDLVAYLAEK